MKMIAVAALMVAMATASTAMAEGWMSGVNKMAAGTYCRNLADAYATARQNFDRGVDPDRNVNMIATSYNMSGQEAYTVVSAAFKDKKYGGSAMQDKQAFYQKCVDLSSR